MERVEFSPPCGGNGTERNFISRGPRKIRRFCGERRNKRNGVKPARRAGFTECSLFRRAKQAAAEKVNLTA